MSNTSLFKKLECTGLDKPDSGADGSCGWYGNRSQTINRRCPICGAKVRVDYSTPRYKNYSEILETNPFVESNDD